MHSPSFRALRSYSSKRRRSPDTSPSPLERHSKRISLAVDSEFIPSPTLQPHALPGLNSASTSRFSSEDWVQQADGLTIDSPLSPSVASEVVHINKQERMDDVMTMDSEDMSTYKPQHSSPRSHRPHIQITTTSSHHAPQQQYHPSNNMQSSFLSAPSQYVYSLPPQTALHEAPMICVHPATPSDSPITHQDQNASRAPSTTTQSSPISPMTVSPTNSPITNRKQRFTMGPRSDCEKCRTGVKGHWMHFD